MAAAEPDMHLTARIAGINPATIRFPLHTLQHAVHWLNRRKRPEESMSKYTLSRPLIRVLIAAAITAVPSSAFAQQAPKHNVIIFIADGLRHGAVDAENMP